MARQATARSPRKRLPPAEGELIRLTALQLAIIASIESGTRKEQYGSLIIQDVADDLKLDTMPLATVYTALRRLENRGFLTSRWGEPGPDGGNRRRFYKVAPVVAKAARRVGKVLTDRLQPASRRAR